MFLLVCGSTPPMKASQDVMRCIPVTVVSGANYVLYVGISVIPSHIWLRQYGHHFADHIFTLIFLYGPYCILIGISLKCVPICPIKLHIFSTLGLDEFSRLLNILFMCMYLGMRRCTCMYTYVCVRVYVCAYEYTHVQECMHVIISLWMLA